MKIHAVKTFTLTLACSLGISGTPVSAQLLNGPNLPNVRIDDTVNRVQRQVSKSIERDINLPDTIDTTAISDNAINALSNLPAALPIVDTAGKTAFVEVVTKDGWRALQREWLLYTSDRHRSKLEKLGLHIIANKRLGALQLSILRVRAPEGLDEHDALTTALQKIDSSIVVERNFVYSAQAQAGKTAGAGNTPVTPLYQGTGAIGMIDTAIDSAHPALKDNAVIQHNFVDDGLPAPQAHGTAVAGRLLGDYGYAPKAKLFSASVFYKRNAYQEGAATHSLLQALDWLLSENVAVINMSLAGPPNAILELSLKNAAQKGALIIAAVGNEGPASPPLYPAAYPSVVAVTAVDNKAQVYRWAVQGKHVEIAAHGVGVFTARAGSDYGFESGTSMAAPLITAYVAHLFYDQQLGAKGARAELARTVTDTGTRGRDERFGFGIFTLN